MWSNDAKQQNCVRNKRKRDAHTHRDSLNWAAKPSFLLSAIVYFDFFSWRRTKSNFSLDIFFLHQFTINRLIHLNFWFASHINRVTISNGWNRNETTEIFSCFFWQNTKLLSDWHTYFLLYRQFPLFLVSSRPNWQAISSEFTAINCTYHGISIHVRV